MTEAEATLDSFIIHFNAGTSVDDVVNLFAPNAQFWGTTISEFGTDTNVIRNYFTSAFGRRAGATVKASITGRSASALAADVVTIIGHWQIERGGNINRLRFSVALNKQNGRWLITQFHSSPRPA